MRPTWLLHKRLGTCLGTQAAPSIKTLTENENKQMATQQLEPKFFRPVKGDDLADDMFNLFADINHPLVEMWLYFSAAAHTWQDLEEAKRKERKEHYRRVRDAELEDEKRHR